MSVRVRVREECRTRTRTRESHASGATCDDRRCVSYSLAGPEAIGWRQGTRSSWLDLRHPTPILRSRDRPVPHASSLCHVGLLLLGLGILACGCSGASESPAETDFQPAVRRVTPVATAESLAAQCRRRAVRLPQQLAQPIQTIVRPPLVLAGDLPEAELLAKYEATIQPVCQALAATYFRRPPQQPVLVLMLTTEAAYRRAAEQLFVDRDVSRYGYYKPGRQAVLVSLAEGDGPLFHELTHVLMDADFPGAPPWLQEGLATLHEAVELSAGPRNASPAGPASPAGRASPDVASLSHAGRPAPGLTPLPNWRGTVLRQAMAGDRLPSLEAFTARASFRGATEALDYACARYLCLFLHRRGILPRYYAALRERVDDDPTGRQTLLDVCAASDWNSLDAEFRAWWEADENSRPCDALSISAANGTVPGGGINRERNRSAAQGPGEYRLVGG